MACPLCGEVCRCSFAPRADAYASGDGASPSHTSILIDPDDYEPTEEQFAASVAGTAQPAAPEPQPPAAAVAPAPAAPARQTTLTGIERVAAESGGRDEESYSGEAWRSEVASRLNSYRARRRRDPDASMRLDFGGDPEPAPHYRSAAVQRVATRYANRPAFDAPPEPPAETKVIEFPRPTPVPETLRLMEQFRAGTPSELAEPVPDTPRILDAPEPEEMAIMPPVTAITLDGDGEETETAGTELELPLRAAPLGQRLYASLVDTAVVLAAGCAFLMIFLKIAGSAPQSKLTAGFAMAVFALLWSGYQYLFLVHGATTPGMQMAHVGVCDFEGRPLTRSERRSRALAIIIAALPLGLGFIWALLDEDGLCWHDRMARSYVVES